MKNAILATLAAVMALSLTACSTTPMDDTSGSMGSVSDFDTTASAVPESGPLVQPPAMSSNNYQTPAYTPPTDTYAAYKPVPAYQAPSPATTAGDGYGEYGYTPTSSVPATPPVPTPVANTDNGGASYYDSYTNNSYGSGGTSNSGYDYSSISGNDYSSPKPSVNSGSAGSASGAFAVQVLASGNNSKAESMKRELIAMGLKAVVDPVGGLYKVRVPFGSKSEASSNLARIRSLTGESGAFITSR